MGHSDTEDAGEAFLIAPEAAERDACLACQLLRCLQTTSAVAATPVPAPVGWEALLPDAVRVARVAAWVKGSARSPPLV